VTVSIGRAFHRPDEAGCALVNRADAALYASKNRGRNMVTLAAAA
jgi:PleD family two-component response regulator